MVWVVAVVTVVAVVAVSLIFGITDASIHLGRSSSSSSSSFVVFYSSVIYFFYFGFFYFDFTGEGLRDLDLVALSFILLLLRGSFSGDLFAAAFFVFFF